MKRGKVKGSSNIAEIGYDFDNKTLEILFHNGKIYQYWPVSGNLWEQFYTAESKGSFFAKCIRSNPKISYRKLDDELQAAD